jgi:hypothetical protein
MEKLKLKFSKISGYISEKSEYQPLVNTLKLDNILNKRPKIHYRYNSKRTNFDF